MMSPPPSDLSETSFDAAMQANFARGRSPYSSDSDSDGEEDDDMTMAVRYPRDSISSTTSSIMMEERLEALQKVNEELRKKLKEAEDNLKHRMEDSDDQLHSLEVELQEAHDALSAFKRQEKDTKQKEVSDRLFYVYATR